MFAAAVVLGVVSSLHCVTMCSPLAMAVSSLNGPAFLNRVIYNFGRVSTYALLGGLVGTVGSFFPLEKFENLISIIIGLALVLGGVYGISRMRIKAIDAFMARATGYIRNIFGKFLRKGSRVSTFALGMINGILPCSMTFFALTVSLTTGSTINGVSYMLLFGLGTLPAMLGMHSLLIGVITKLRLNFSRVNTALMVLSGFLLIARVFLLHGAHIDYGNREIIDIIMCR